LTVYAIWWLLSRCTGVRLEVVFVAAGLAGIGTTVVGNAMGERYVAAGGALLWGWLVIPVLVLLLW